MNTINTLTVNGQSYALPDPRSVLDDSAASPDSTWSSQKLAAVDTSASIVCGASGTEISLCDASDRTMQGLTVYGKTTQNGTPTPDSPIALESVGSSGSITVTVSGDTAQQTLTLSTPNGLPGIPVPSGGNYTDETGQQWICDEIDLTRGVYVKRISTVDMGDLSYNFHSEAIRFTTAIGTMMYDGVVAYPVLATCYRSQYNLGYGVSKSYAISTFYSYGTTVIIGDPRTTSAAELKELLAGEKLMYVRKTPIETPISAEELAAYAALHTNKPNTTVYNDASAHMALCYVADTKAYIDRKLAALAREVTA